MREENSSSPLPQAQALRNKHWELRLEKRWTTQKCSFHLKAQLLGDRLPTAASFSWSTAEKTLQYASLTNFTESRSGNRQRQVYLVGTLEDPQLTFHLVATLSSTPQSKIYTV